MVRASNYYLLCNSYYWNLPVSDLSCRYGVICTLILYEVIRSPLIFAFVLVAIVHLLYSTDLSTAKGVLKIFCACLWNQPLCE